MGNHVCLGLIGLGIGTIKIYDFDVIESHNLNRQSLFCEEDITQSKAETLAKRLKERNSLLEIIGIQEKITEENIEDLIRGVHLIIDCVDRISVRRILSRFCLENNLPLIHGGVSWNGGQVGILTRATPCINCIYPESDQQREIEEETSCTRKPEAGVVYISQIIAGLMVEAVRRVILPLSIDPPFSAGLIKYQTEVMPPFYFQETNRKDPCECREILQRVAPDILENEKLQQINRDQHKNEEDLAELTKMMEEPESDE